MNNGLATTALASIVVIASAGMSRAAEPVTLKFGFPAPVTSFVNTDGITPWIDRVEKAAGGMLNIKLFADPTLGTFRDIYERTLSGVSQISFGGFGTLASQFPRTQVTEIRFLSTDTKKSSVAL
jgi:TRAP-type C4-dicarboxylate transport system substrate-binding protein